MGNDSLAVVAVRVTAARRSSGVETTDDFGHLIEFRGGRVAGTTFHRAPEEALEAAGLSDWQRSGPEIR